MRLRAPIPDDARAILAVLVARDMADLGVPDSTLEDLLDEWRCEDLSLPVDARVVEADRRIAFTELARRTHAPGCKGTVR